MKKLLDQHIKILALCASIPGVLLVMYGWVLRDNSRLIIVNYHMEIKYFMHALLLELLVLSICEAVWGEFSKKQLMVVCALCIGLYFVPLAVSWYFHQSQLKMSILSSDYIMPILEQDEYKGKILFDVRYIMVSISAAIFSFLLKNSLEIKRTRKDIFIRFVVIMGSCFLLCLNYFQSEQQAKEEMRSFYNDQASILFRMKMEAQQMVLAVEEHEDKLEDTISFQDKLWEYCDRQHVESGVGTADMYEFLDTVIDGKEWFGQGGHYQSLSRNDRMVLAHEMSQQIYLDMRVLVADEVSRCYLGLYTPRHCPRTYDDWCMDEILKKMTEEQLPSYEE